MFKFAVLIASLALSGCVHIATSLEYAKVSNDFVGDWEQTNNCKVHKTMKGVVKIRKNSEQPDELQVAWKGRDFSTFNGMGKLEYIDYEKKSYQISTDVEVFDNGRTLVFASIWKRTQGDHKNLAGIMKKYQLNEKGQLIYEKRGYTAFEEGKKFQLKSYSEYFPDNYHCVMKKVN